MLLVGALSPIRAAIVIVAQIVGGIAGSAIIYGLLPGTLNVRTTLAEGVSPGRGLCIEMFMTALLMLTILLLAAEKHKGTFLAPLPIGLSLFLAELVSVAYTGGSLNARLYLPGFSRSSAEDPHYAARSLVWPECRTRRFCGLTLDLLGRSSPWGRDCRRLLPFHQGSSLCTPTRSTVPT